jgi:hypothetical protein
MIQTTLRRMTQRAYREGGFAHRCRTERMYQFLDRVRPPWDAKIIDLGGTPDLWQLVPHEFDLTIVNLTVEHFNAALPPRTRFVQGDVTDLTDLFEDKSFDVVFSNSVIEHVGDDDKQQAMADEVHRLADAYWVQTPSDRFPIEPHVGLPFYWHWPVALRRRLERRWQRRYVGWGEMVASTRVLSAQRMAELFPEASIYRETRLKLEKSYACYQPYAPAPIAEPAKIGAEAARSAFTWQPAPRRPRPEPQPQTNATHTTHPRE